MLRVGGDPKKKRPLHQVALGQDEPQVKNRVKRKSKEREAEDEEFIEPTVTRKILAQAKKQQDEIKEDEDNVKLVLERPTRVLKATPSSAKSDSDDECDGAESAQFSDEGSDFPEEEIELDEEDERVMEMFMPSDRPKAKTLADIIMERIKEKEAERMADTDERDDQEKSSDLSPKVVEVYQRVGQLLQHYRSGKIPKAFKIVPALRNWEEILYLTNPAAWSSVAIYQATRLFASNLNANMAQRFYNTILLPRVRDDIEEHKRLNFHLYQALKKSLYKPAAFYKGILLPLCESRTCSLREGTIIASVLARVSVPVLHSAAALLKMAEMDYSGATSLFMRTLIDKKYALPYRVIDALVSHFAQFTSDSRQLPVAWHQCLLTFVQRYKTEITAEAKETLKILMRSHEHPKITKEIRRELFHSVGRDEKDAMMV
mmetsp:Transcript_15096/g.24849  ORF Transcript_15096/g.24849 Transcript_15096/m.24849 type:complete len:431 (-) Transcript_15096:486-1778(-)